jgi:hypothetical protein
LAVNDLENPHLLPLNLSISHGHFQHSQAAIFLLAQTSPRPHHPATRYVNRQGYTGNNYKLAKGHPIFKTISLGS